MELGRGYKNLFSLLFLTRFYSVTIEAKELNIMTETHSDLLEKRNSVYSFPLYGASTIYMVNFKCPFVRETTGPALTAKEVHSSGVSWAIAPSSTKSRKFLGSTCVGCTPLIDLSLFTKVDTPSAPAAIDFGVRPIAIYTDSQFHNIENLSHGSRVEKAL